MGGGGGGVGAKFIVVFCFCHGLTHCFTNPIKHSIAFTITGTNQSLSTKTLRLVGTAMGEEIVSELQALFNFIGPGVEALLRGDGAVDIDDSDSRTGPSASIRWWEEEEGSGGVYSMTASHIDLEIYRLSLTSCMRWDNCAG